MNMLKTIIHKIQVYNTRRTLQTAMDNTELGSSLHAELALAAKSNR